MSLVRYEPWSLLRDMEKEMSRLFRRFPLAPTRGVADFETSGWLPEVDIEDKGDAYQLTANIPDVDPKNLEIQFCNGVLTIRGKTESQREESGKSYLRAERSYGEFTRSFSFPDVDNDAQIDAECKNGVLCLKLPKSKASVSRRIEIKTD